MTGFANSVAINVALGHEPTIVDASKRQYRHRTVLDSTRHGPLSMIKKILDQRTDYCLIYFYPLIRELKVVVDVFHPLHCCACHCLPISCPPQLTIHKSIASSKRLIDERQGVQALYGRHSLVPVIEHRRQSSQQHSTRFEETVA